MAAMILVFTVLYFVIVGREGFAYGDAILVAHQENGSTVYSGELQGKQAAFTVYADKTVEFQYGDIVYGPYVAVEDSTAVPSLSDRETEELMTGVELRCGEEVLFRGGVLDFGDQCWLYNEDGTLEDTGFSVTVKYAATTDEGGNVADTMEPSASTILDLMAGPELTHKGEWFAWFCGIFICIVTAIFVLFADELFRWNLAFRIRYADRAEPSGWEIASRYITWTILPLMALAVFIVGLQ